MTSYNAPGNIQYNYAQLEGIWCQAGGSPTAAPIAAAIAMAESGGNTTATDQDSNGSVDRGLWQINSVHGAQSTYDVMGNARAAIAISNNGQNWAPWTTYTSGAYRQFVQTNIPADMSAPINGTNAAANATLTGDLFPGGSYDPLNNQFDPINWFLGTGTDNPIASAIQGAIITVLNPLIAITAGILGITAGGTMVLVGIFLIVKSTDTGQEVGRAAGSAAKLGMDLAAPETAATTQYISGRTGQATQVTQTRKAAGAVKVGGQRIQYRPAKVRTDVQRPDTVKQTSTRDKLRNEAGQYTKGKPPK